MNNDSKEKWSEDYIEHGIVKMGFSIEKTQIESLIRFSKLLQKWNRNINLTTITGQRSIIVEHLFDSLSIAPHLLGDRILDVGSGAGFPGLPLAILHGDLRFTLLDSRRKKTGFLRAAVDELRLENVNLVNERVERYQPSESFDTITARAFASLAEFLKVTSHLYHQKLRLLAMKGRYPQIELEEIKNLLLIEPQVLSLEVPGLEAQRHLVIIDY